MTTITFKDKATKNLFTVKDETDRQYTAEDCKAIAAEKNATWEGIRETTPANTRPTNRRPFRRTYGCRAYTRDNGCPLHGETCAR